jgi:predicted kinase
MSVIHMLRGLPASGKTTLALEMVKEERVKRISKDDLRAMLHGGKYSPDTEMFVLDVRNAIAELAIKQGFDVVIDDTNLNPAHQEQLIFLSDSLGAQFNVIDVHASLDECIQRDKERPVSVGEDVIRGMYAKYIAL